MRKILIYIIIIGSGINLYAQQDYQYTQFMFNKLGFNPAYAGSKGHLNISALYRKQWLGIDRSPQTATINTDGAVWGKKIGLGLSVSYDQIGFSQRVSIESNYSYVLRFKQSSLSFGIRASAYYTQIKWDDADYIDAMDPSIPQTTTSKILPNFGAGIYYQAKNFYLGFSVPHIFTNTNDFNISFNGTVEPEFTQHYFLMGGMSFKLVRNIQVQQNLLLKYVVNAPLSIDLNLSLVFFKKILIGVTYRTNASIDAILQWQITHQLRIGAAYDYSINKLQQYNVGSFEAMVSYSLVKKNDGLEYDIYNERFF